MNIKDLVGKVVTVSTVEINQKYSFEQMTNYFVGILEDVTDDALWLIHPVTKCRTYIARKYVVVVCEEQVLYEDNPEDAELIEELKKEKPVTAARIPLSAPPSKYVNPEELSKLAKYGQELNQRK